MELCLNKVLLSVQAFKRARSVFWMPSAVTFAACHSLFADAPRVTLTILTVPRVVAYSPSAAYYSFDATIAHREKPIDFVFTLRNSNPETISISRLQPSCGCTHAEEEGAVHPLRLIPGQQVHIKMSIDLKEQPPGVIDKFVSVFVEGQKWPAATLEMTGTLLPNDAPSRRSLSVGEAAPRFSLIDAHGLSVSSIKLHDHPVPLFFFCGCSWCRRYAQEWGFYQHTTAHQIRASEQKRILPAEAVIIFSGDVASARDFARDTNLDPAQTVLLPDPHMTVTGDYSADPCPRVFVLDKKGIVRYTNNHLDDDPHMASPQAITSHVRDALSAAE